MSDKKSNAPLIIVIVLAVLALPCMAGVVLLVAGGLLWKGMGPQPMLMPPAAPMVAPLVTDDPSPPPPRVEEAKAETSEPAVP